jgi:hypothetical protein
MASSAEKDGMTAIHPATFTRVHDRMDARPAYRKCKAKPLVRGMSGKQFSFLV